MNLRVLLADLVDAGRRGRYTGHDSAVALADATRKVIEQRLAVYSYLMRGLARRAVHERQMKQQALDAFARLLAGAPDNERYAEEMIARLEGQAASFREVARGWTAYKVRVRQERATHRQQLGLALGAPLNDRGFMPHVFDLLGLAAKLRDEVEAWHRAFGPDGFEAAEALARERSRLRALARGQVAQLPSNLARYFSEVLSGYGLDYEAGGDIPTELVRAVRRALADDVPSCLADGNPSPVFGRESLSPLAEWEDAGLLATAVDRASRDAGGRHALADVAAELGEHDVDSERGLEPAEETPGRAPESTPQVELRNEALPPGDVVDVQASERPSGGSEAVLPGD